jgi:mediator of RNA polymerase II transcription subunit 16, fungi type
MDLLCWLADCLFCLLDDQKFRNLLQPQQFANMNPYLHHKNEIALHMLLSSSIRGLLSAVCRRMNHLHGISLRAISYYESRSTGNSNDPNSRQSGPPQALHQAYLKVLRNTSSHLIDVAKFDELLALLGKNIRQQYNDSFAEIGKRAAAEAAKRNPNVPKNIAEEAIKRAQTHCELTMLLAGSPPSTLALVVQRFFSNDLVEFRSKCNPAELFFANYDLLEVDDEPKVLAARKQRSVRVDLFKRVEIFHHKRPAGSAGEEEQLPWRRCVRCASVMEDATMTARKPGIMFVLSQQRNCCCGGRLAILGKDELVG